MTLKGKYIAYRVDSVSRRPQVSHHAQSGSPWVKTQCSECSHDVWAYTGNFEDRVVICWECNDRL